MESIKEILARAEHSILSRAESTKSLESTIPEKCKACGDTGYVRVALPDGPMRLCDCAIEKRVNLRIPQRYRRASLLDVSEQLRKDVLEWFGHPGDGLFITGAAGRGKTHLAAAIVRTLVSIQLEAFFLRCADFYAELREAYRNSDSEKEVLRPWIEAPYLVLDDLGSGSLSDFQRYSIVELFDRRMNDRKATVVTTNWDLAQISEKMDERISSRLEAFTAIKFTGPDRRARA